jgi:hypothetical protein
MDNIDDVRNSIVISLATCGGMARDSHTKRCIDLTIASQNTDKAYPQREVYNTYTITKELFQELKNEAYELFMQIEGMIEEEETKTMEINKKKEEEKKKFEKEKEERKKLRALSKKPLNVPSKEKDIEENK